MNLARSIMLAFVLSLVCLKIFGQTTERQVLNRDSSQTILLEEFDQRVDRATMLLKTKKLSAISDSDHVNIMMCWNTIFMAGVKSGERYVRFNGEKFTLPNYKKRFSGGRYAKLEKMIDKIEYTTNLSRIYPDWLPSRGMGVFFVKLQMSMMGTPEPYSLFEVIK